MEKGKQTIDKTFMYLSWGLFINDVINFGGFWSVTKQHTSCCWWVSFQLSCSFYVKVWYDPWFKAGNVFEIMCLPKISTKRGHFVIRPIPPLCHHVITCHLLADPPSPSSYEQPLIRIISRIVWWPMSPTKTIPDMFFLRNFVSTPS